MSRRHSREWHRMHDEALAEHAMKRRAEAPPEESAPAPAWKTEAPPAPVNLEAVAAVANTKYGRTPGIDTLNRHAVRSEKPFYLRERE